MKRDVRNRASMMILCPSEDLCLSSLHVEGDIHRIDKG
jgi:hypothetical protein